MLKDTYRLLENPVVDLAAPLAGHVPASVERRQQILWRAVTRRPSQ